MNDLESLLRRLIKDEIHSALEEFLPRLQCRNEQQHSTEDTFLLSTSDAAKMLAVSRSTLSSLTRSGQLPCVRIGGAKRYNVKTLRSWVTASKSKTFKPIRVPSRVRQVSLPQIKNAKAAVRISQAKVDIQAAAGKGSENQENCLDEHNTQEDMLPPNPFRLLLEQIGVADADLPPITNGDLMRIADVDIPTLHGWLYLGRSMPELALEKLRIHFGRYRKQDESFS